MHVAGWRAYYTDDRAYASSETAWGDLPRDGLLYLTVYYDETTDSGVRYTQNFSGDDWYFHEPGTDLFGSNSDSLSENWLRYPECVFRRGQWTSKAELARIRHDATTNPCP